MVGGIRPQFHFYTAPVTFAAVFATTSICLINSCLVFDLIVLRFPQLLQYLGCIMRYPHLTWSAKSPLDQGISLSRDQRLKSCDDHAGSDNRVFGLMWHSRMPPSPSIFKIKISAPAIAGPICAIARPTSKPGQLYTQTESIGNFQTTHRLSCFSTGISTFFSWLKYTKTVPLKGRCSANILQHQEA